MSTTAAVSLQQLWLTDPTDPSTVVNAYSVSRGQTFTMGGEFRQYASGRMRLITNTTNTLTIPVQLTLVPTATALQLVAWRGKTLLMRDGVGLRVWGAYLQLDLTDHWDVAGVLSDVNFTFTQVTYADPVSG